MKKILYLHGFGSSGASGTVELLRKEFWNKDAAHRATVTAPDIPVDPAVAMPMLEALAYDEMPDLVVGTSMGGMYAQLLRGFTRICVNPSLTISKKYNVLYVGKHKWLNRRKDGATEFHVTKEIIAHFQDDARGASDLRAALSRHVPCLLRRAPHECGCSDAYAPAVHSVAECPLTVVIAKMRGYDKICSFLLSQGSGMP